MYYLRLIYYISPIIVDIQSYNSGAQGEQFEVY